MKFTITHTRTLTEETTDDVLSQYIENPYGIGAIVVSDQGKFYEISCSDSLKRDKVIKEIKSLGIQSKYIGKSMAEKGLKYRHRIIVWK